jgi:hypothetical protein
MSAGKKKKKAHSTTKGFLGGKERSTRIFIDKSIMVTCYWICPLPWVFVALFSSI